MNPDELAARLISAADSRTATSPLSVEYPSLDVPTAYGIQDAVVRARTDAGAITVGAKLGLTSAAKQKQMNVSEPLYGVLTDDMRIDTGEVLECARFIQPRCEPEIAFLLAEDLEGAHVSAAHVLAATALVFPAVDVLDSRFAGYSFTLPDVVADNSSCAAFVVGGQGVDPVGLDLRTIGCVFEKNGVVIATAAGAAVLGHPASSVAWLVRKLAERDRGLRAGDIVLSGSMTEAVPVAPGDVVTARMDILGTVEIACV